MSSSIQSKFVRFLISKSNMWNKPLDEIRSDMEKMKSPKIPNGFKITDETVNGVRCVKVKNEKCYYDKVIVYFHGGGFCLGIYDVNCRFVLELSERTGMDAYIVDYGLAPENPYPRALTDSIDFYMGFTEKIKSENVIFIGDSSGCGLMTSLIFEMDKRNVNLPDAAVMITPVLDFHKDKAFLKKDPFKLEDPLGLAKKYFNNNGNSLINPKISPMYGEFKDFPRLLIHGAECDTFLEDAKEFYKKINRMGKRAILKEWKGMWHTFHMQYQIIPESREAIKEIADFLK